MKDKVVLIAILVAALCVLIGFIGKLFSTQLYLANYTWHMFAQTCLLFAIAWALGKKAVNKE
jgi:hypothetical protein